MSVVSHFGYERNIGSDTLVLCVHGIQGSPRQFDFLVSELPNSIDYKCVLLPGHGSSIANFRRCWDVEWKEYILHVCETANEKYKRTIFVGHSMGCLLGIYAQSMGIIQFDGMLLLSPPLKIHVHWRYILSIMRLIFQNNQYADNIKAMKQANSINASNPLNYITCIKPYVGLLKLISYSRKEAGKLDVPLIAIHSDMDELVSAKSLSWFRKAPNSKVLTVFESGHYMYSDYAIHLINAQLKALLML